MQKSSSSKSIDIANHNIVIGVSPSSPVESPITAMTSSPIRIPIPGQKESAGGSQSINHIDMQAYDEIEEMTLDELKTWVIGAIAQYEQQHSLTLQELQTALAQHAQNTTTAQNTAQSAQNSSKYAVWAAVVTGSASILVCVASSLLSHFL